MLISYSDYVITNYYSNLRNNWYLTSDFNVNQVTMSFDEQKVKPGTDINLNINASPTSTCFVGMVDKSVTLLAGNNQLTPSQVKNTFTSFLSSINSFKGVFTCMYSFQISSYNFAEARVITSCYLNNSHVRFHHY